MEYIYLLSLLCFGAPAFLSRVYAQHENVPYQDVQNICETCLCVRSQDVSRRYHHTLNCATKNFQHILARWPVEFGVTHDDIDVISIFSGNPIELLQQLPATNASLTFSCRHCGIRNIQAPTFLDVPNLKHLDLSWNEIRAGALTPDVFRGRFQSNRYEPIMLLELDLGHNKLHTLERRLFEHTPYLTKLDLSYNQLSLLDSPTTMALSSVPSLEVLILSHTGLHSIPPIIFKALISLKELYLDGNALKTVPENLKLIGRSLEVLNLASNNLTRLNETGFSGLQALKRVNISFNSALSYIDSGSFQDLKALECLDFSHNRELQTFNLDTLMHCRNLTQLDISYGGIRTLSLTSPKAGKNASNQTFPLPWPRLRIFEIAGNPWRCDCALMRVFEQGGIHRQHHSEDTRCDSPYMLAGAEVSNLTAELLCVPGAPKDYRFVEEDPPRFLRRRYMILTAITASVVIVLGLIIGFLVVCIKKRLKNEDFGVEPIRYTSIRSSNLSAFSQTIPPIGNSSQP